MDSLVSIITPIYNAEKYVAYMIQSVIDQFHAHWELILINDGSTDRSKEVALSFSDPRIRYYEQENKGVSVARNVGLSHMKGDFFCFLDADDAFTRQSLSARLAIFRQHDRVGFVDGVVQTYDANLKEFLRKWTPQFRGRPLGELLKLSDKCFFGITWMIKCEKGRHVSFDKRLAIGEDLFFCIQYAQKTACEYHFTNEPIYKRRSTPESASSSISKLATGYHELQALLHKENYLDEQQAAFLGKKIRSIILKSSLRHMSWQTLFKELIGAYKIKE